MGGVVCAFLVCFYVVSIMKRFPWHALDGITDTSLPSYLYQWWPKSPLEEILEEKKKLRKFAKVEQDRRKNLRLRRMDILQVPTLDLGNEGSVVYTSPETSLLGIRSLIWPDVSLNRSLAVHGQSQVRRPLRYVFFPKNFQLQVEEALFLDVQEELLINFNPSSNRRSVYFQFFALNPGVVRVTIGPHVWTKTIQDSEVHKPLTAVVQVNDASANQARIVSQAMALYITKLSLNQAEKGGRAPVFVGADSRVWQIPQHKLEPESSDPDIQENKRVVGPETLALGYNLVWVTMPPLPHLLDVSGALSTKLTPHLEAFKKAAAGFVTEGDGGWSEDQAFRSVLVGQGAHWPPDILIPALHQESAFNVVAQYRNFGYRTGVVAWPSALLFPDDLSNRPHPPLQGRWLSERDEGLALQRRELDQAGVETSGLDAIFKSPSHTPLPPLGATDFASMAALLKAIAQDRQGVPDWKSQSLSVIQPGPMFTARAAQSFHNMVNEMAASRFFIYLGLGALNKDRPALMDLFRVMGVYGLTALPVTGQNLKKAQTLSQAVMADRALGNVLQSLQAQYVFHRTLVAVYIPPWGGQAGQIWVKIPGVHPKSQGSAHGPVTVAKVVDGMMVMSGLPKEATPLGKGHTLDEAPKIGEQKDWNTKPPIESNRYHVLMMGDKSFHSPCAPIYWQSRAPLGQVFSERAVAVQPQKGVITFYPCEAGPLTHVRWNQTAGGGDEAPSEETPEVPGRQGHLALRKALGGQFFVDAGPTLPAVFLFGPRKVRLGHLLLSLHSLPNVHQFFKTQPSAGVLIDESHLKKLAKVSGKPVFHFWIERAY